VKSSNTNTELESAVRARLNSLTKPLGSLGKLEELALRFALVRGELLPLLSRKGMYIFCADHGVTAEGVSAYPSEVTAQMVQNFLHGGAAINVLCRQFDIQPVVVDMGVRGDAVPGVLDRKVASGTKNFLHEPAMSREQAEQAIAMGRELAEDAAISYDLVGLGEMGIGNTTAAAALLSVFSGRTPEETVGAGTGLDDAGIARKIDVVKRAIQLHRPDPSDGVAVIAALGGFEIGAMAGFLLGASATRLPVVLDGFISCSAALVARAINPDALQSAFFSHRSEERGHSMMLSCLDAEPCMDLGLRLGEGTGAALMINLIESAVRLYREMATFEEAKVTG
jgi:nicotinate-nucleotide--dimethylbenzimidazole phosphoribosyltransferase